MSLQDIPTVPTPPYPDLRRALEAFDELVDIVSGLVPVAIDDAADLGYEPIDAGELAFSESDDSDRSGGHLASRNRARRRFTRLLLQRILADDDVVLYPVPRPIVDPSGQPIGYVPRPALDYPGQVISPWWTSSHGVAIAVTHQTDIGPGLIVDGRALSPVDIAAIREYFAPVSEA